MATSQAPGNILSNTGSSDELTNKLELISQSASIKNIVNALPKDADLHVVGGTVREIMQTHKATDIDLATRLEPDEVLKCLEQANIRVIETGISHGTLLALSDDNPIEITTFRKPGPRNSGLFSKAIQEDLSGRDFTINAIAFNIERSEIIDPHDGIKDLHAKTLKAVSDPHARFEEDPHRLLRLIRFGPAKNFSIEKHTALAAEKLTPLITSVSIERVQSELSKILLSANPAAAIKMMREFGLLQILIPEIIATFDFEQNDFHIHDVFEHTLWVLERSDHDLIVRLAALFHDIGKPATLSIDDEGNRHFYKHELESERLCITAMERLLFPKKVIKDTALLVRNHMRPLDCGPSAVRRLIRDLGPLFEKWLALKRADSPPTMPQKDFERMYENFLNMKSNEEKRLIKSQRSGLAVTGDDLKELGIEAGPNMGHILKELEEIILDYPEVNTKEKLLEFVKNNKLD